MARPDKVNYMPLLPTVYNLDYASLQFAAHRQHLYILQSFFLKQVMHVLSLAKVRQKSWTWRQTAKWDGRVRPPDCQPTLLFLLLLKKKLYNFHSHSKCVIISECSRKREGGWRGRERGQTVCTPICRCIVHAVILLVVIGVSERPHTGLIVPGRPARNHVET